MRHDTLKTKKTDLTDNLFTFACFSRTSASIIYSGIIQLQFLTLLTCATIRNFLNCRLWNFWEISENATRIIMALSQDAVFCIKLELFQKKRFKLARFKRFLAWHFINKIHGLIYKLQFLQMTKAGNKRDRIQIHMAKISYLITLFTFLVSIKYERFIESKGKRNWRNGKRVIMNRWSY